MELVLIALCGCTASDVVGHSSQEARAVHAASKSAPVASAHRDIPPCIRKSSSIYRIGGKVSHKAVEDAVRLSKEKYCSVSAMLAKNRQDHESDRIHGSQPLRKRP